MPPKAKAKDKGKAPQSLQNQRALSLLQNSCLQPSSLPSLSNLVMRQLLKMKNLQNHHKYKQTQFNIGLTLYPNRQNYSWHCKKYPNKPLVTPCLKQVVFPNHFQNPKEAFYLQNPSFPYNKQVFQKPNPNIFSKMLSKIF